MYHYTLCGLSNVYLVNGFELSQNAHGECISIDKLEELHETIAMSIIQTPRELTGEEFRFLRKEMDLSQKKLSALLSVDVQTVANWEKDKPTAIASKLLKFIARSHYTDTGFKDFIHSLAETDRQEHEILYFKEMNSNWLKVAA